MADQPGLEIAPPTHPAAASHFFSTSKGLPTTPGTAPEVVPLERLNGHSFKQEGVQPLDEKHKFFVRSALGKTNNEPLRSKRRLLLPLGILFLVVAAAIIGGVVGSRHSSNMSPTRTSPLPTLSPQSPSSLLPTSLSAASVSATSTPTPLNSPRSNSRLAASGWRTDGGFISLRVFYQDQSSNLRFSEYNSDDRGWASSQKVRREGVLSVTGMGASSIVYNNPPQMEFFFLSKSSMLSGSNFRDGWTPLSGSDDSIDSYPIPLHSRSRLATYWPYIVLQTTNLSLHLVTYPWQNQSLEITALDGTSLAIVPQSATYDDPHPVALMYRRNDGLLAVGSLYFNGTLYDRGVATIDIPQTSSFGAFAVAREKDPNNATDIYVVYQSASNDLQYAHYLGDSWEPGPVSDALKNADASTDITCLTEGIWYGSRALSTAYDMSRCYFFSGGQIKEVGFDGTTWTDMGYVPLT